MGAIIIAEIGDFNRFDSADKILAYARMSPSTYQSGKIDNCRSHIEKRGSRYLRYALYMLLSPWKLHTGQVDSGACLNEITKSPLYPQ